MIFGKKYISEALVVVVIGMCLNEAFGHPVSYKELAPGEPVEMTTTPKKIKDTFQLKKQVITIPQNDSKKPLAHTSNLNYKTKYNDIPYEPVTYKVKASNLGDKPSKQSDDDDDDDDDGGEYEGAADYASCKKKDQEEPQEKSKSMPIMIIRQFDVMAMDVPIPNGKNEACNHTEDVPNYLKNTDWCETKYPGQRGRTEINKDKAWGDWSSCSKSCGEGVQTRSRIKPSGNPDRDIQVRTCNLAECQPDPRISAAHRLPPAQYKYRELNTH